MQGANRSAFFTRGPQHAPYLRVMGCLCVLLACAAGLGAAQEKKELRYTVSSPATVNIANDYGSVTIHSTPGNQVVVSAALHSPAVSVRGNQSGSQIDLRSVHAHSGGSEAVDYDVQVPPDASLLIRGTSGPVHIQNVSGSIEVDFATGGVDVQDGRSGLVRIETIDGPVTLTNVSGGSIHVRTVSGEVTLANTSGPALQVVTNSSAIHFSGPLPANSDCELATHSGDIDVALPASASVDVSASTVTGSAQDSFHLAPDSGPALGLAAGKSFAGHASAGSATLKLRSFSGKITVKKQETGNR